jgi:hypothetical protein
MNAFRPHGGLKKIGANSFDVPYNGVQTPFRVLVFKGFRDTGAESLEGLHKAKGEKGAYKETDYDHNLDLVCHSLVNHWKWFIRALR